MAVTSVDTRPQNRKVLITINKLYMRDWCMTVNSVFIKPDIKEGYSVMKNVNMEE